MAFHKNCLDFDAAFCSSQTNWTERKYNACSMVETEARSSFHESEEVCYFIQTAMFLFDFCRSSITTWNYDMLSCLKQFGVIAGICYTSFPDFTSRSFENCFNIIVENIGERQNESHTEWFYHIHDVICSMNDSHRVGICGRFLVEDSIFNITWYTPSEMLVDTYGYVVLVVGAVVIISNTIMMVVIQRIISNSSVKLLMSAICVSEMLTALSCYPVFLVVLTTNSYQDYLSYGWCIVIVFICDILSPFLHALSIWFALGMTLQRYLIIKFPLRARMYEGRQSRNLVLIYLTVTVSLVSFLLFPEMLFISYMKQLPVLSKLDISKEIVTAVYQQSMSMKTLKSSSYIIRAVSNQIIPTIIIFVFGILLASQLCQYQISHRKLTRDPSSANRTRIISIITLSLAFIVLITEVPATVMFTMTVLDLDAPFRDILGIYNIFSLVLYPVNLVICCSLIKDFRDKLLSCFLRK